MKKNPYKFLRANDRSHINTLRFIVGALVLCFSMSLIIIWIQSQEPEVQRLSIPPQIQYGAQVTTGQINAWEIYSFTGAMFQQLNYWIENGEEDYLKNIKDYRAFFTGRFIAQAYSDYKLKKNRLELKNRQRAITPLGAYTASDHCGNYHESCVKPLGANRWKVWLDINLREWQKTSEDALPYELKNKSLRIPFLVIYEDTNTEYNPWGLKIDYEYVNEIRVIDIQGGTK